MDRALSSNTALHRCVRLEQASGNEVVGDVRISFYLSPNGTASRGRILTPRYVGSQMESCITDAISAMTFEPFEGRTQRMSWKFTVL